MKRTGFSRTLDKKIAPSKVCRVSKGGGAHNRFVGTKASALHGIVLIIRLAALFFKIMNKKSTPGIILFIKNKGMFVMVLLIIHSIINNY